MTSIGIIGAGNIGAAFVKVAGSQWHCGDDR